MFTVRHYYKLYAIFLVGIVSFNIYVFLVTNKSHKSSFINDSETIADEEIDWHDYKMIADEASRRGPGENGSAVFFNGIVDEEANKKGQEVEGISTLISSKISPNRSLPDMRLEQCKTKKYSKHLPKTSVIIVYFDESLTVMLRCLHSIVNRSPPELLHEIILVNDKSSKIDAFHLFENYVESQFTGKVKMFMNENRKGLVTSRVEAAHRAEGEVIVFMDAHMEVNVNWLPPLLEIVKKNPKSASVPLINIINPETFEYKFSSHGLRGGFDWEMVHHWLPKFKEDQLKPEMPFKLPVMSGEALAIRKDYFFELGAYDEGFKYQKGENFELSFKIWLCGGQILLCPCSHVGHVSRNQTKFRFVTYGSMPYDYKARNFKRVIDVWMDEYKQFVYDAVPGRYAVDAGYLIKQHAMRKQMNCKPFKYFMQEIAPDILERYIIDDRGNFASGAIVSDSDPKLCATFNKNKTIDISLELKNCSRNKVHPIHKQDFTLTWNRSIKYNGSGYKCITLETILKMKPCHFEFGNQLWKYELNTHQIIQPGGSNKCISIDSEKKVLFPADCNSTDVRQKFTWGYTNTSALSNWAAFGVKLP